MENINIFLVDDHQLILDGIKALLSGVNDITIIGEATTGNELLEKIPQAHPDLILMDISLPDISGIELTGIISKRYPASKILILSMYTNEDFVFNAMKAGAKGYLLKNTSRQELLDAIYAIHSGQEFFSGSISQVILKSFLRKVNEPETTNENGAQPLSNREHEILKLFAEGFNNKEISNTLGISIRTVESHKNHIVKKLGLKSTVEMVKFAIKNKIVEL
ncbi:MAG: response regulator transcription factor [Bacteroidales bacterium]|nr:response regulator transcription factor [Bacteroidales bacterium]